MSELSEHDAVLRRFAQAEDLVNRLVDALPKATIAEVGRLLAMNVAHYKRLHGEIPLTETLTLAGYGDDDEGIDTEALSLATDGLEELAALIGLLMDDPDRPARH